MAGTPEQPAAQRYDTIGIGYRRVRQPDPRIEARLHAHLGTAAHVLNVGAGAGSYEPTDRDVVAVEPSWAMLAQRPASTSARSVRAVAEHLPFVDQAFDGALAVLTVHHWPDPVQGLAELRRVTTGPIVVLSFDRDVHLSQWLVRDYFGGVADLDRSVPTPEAIADLLGGGSVEVLRVPHDCVDGFCHAYWRRPEAYLDPQVRAGISWLARQPPEATQRAVQRLSTDLADGTWTERNQPLLDHDELDVGYRIVVSPAG